jgi:hypothetical protein
MDEKLNAGREIRPAMVRQSETRKVEEGRGKNAKARVSPQRARSR